MQFDTALNLLWCSLGVIALVSTIRTGMRRTDPTRPAPWLHVIGVALIVAALFPYISATDDLVRSEDLASRHHSTPGKKTPNDNLIRLYETLDSPVATSTCALFVRFFAVSLVFVPVARHAYRTVPVFAGRSPPLFLSA